MVKNCLQLQRVTWVVESMLHSSRGGGLDRLSAENKKCSEDISVDTLTFPLFHGYRIAYRGNCLHRKPSPSSTSRPIHPYPAYHPTIPLPRMILVHFVLTSVGHVHWHGDSQRLSVYRSFIIVSPRNPTGTTGPQKPLSAGTTRADGLLFCAWPR